ncbi:hypothetical protein JKF63_02442 [Porcisia hertigi]|uniref:Uncharacterized protein n=1 Tax=Porcisia hertigi TaxID=2761500 RepID=A0A836HN33_9TRYP|nr:hypothetical protein JKF63_02442 [Porcisia hertigi]
MRACAHRWRLRCESSGARLPRSTHAAHQLAALSYLLRDPRKSPVVIVAGHTFSACTTLYRVLPTAVYAAYHCESVLDGGVTFNCAEYPNRPHLPSVRLVPHTSALLGPEHCITTGSYVDVFQAVPKPIGAANTKPSLGGEDEGDSLLSESGSILRASKDVEELRQGSTSACADLLLSPIKDERRFLPSHQPRREATPVSPPGKVSVSRSPARLLLNPDFGSPDRGSNATRDGMQREPPPPRIHWVVTRWLINSHADPQKVIDAWRGVLNHSRPGEVASVLLFVNVEVADMVPLIGTLSSHRLQLALRLKGDMAEGDKTPRLSPPLYKCGACAAVWLPLPASSKLRSALLSLQARATAVAVPSSSCDPPAAMTGTTLPPRQASAQVGAAARPSQPRAQIEVPIVRCWDTTAPEEKQTPTHDPVSFTMGSFRRFAFVGDVKPPTHPHHHPCPALDCLQRIPEPLRSWEWVLRKGRSDVCVLPSDAKLSCALPYVLASDAEKEHREYQRALRHNAADAATSRSLKASVHSADVSTTGGPSVNASLPNPRYFTTLVSDAGSLLARDGCLSDLFVLEFQPALLEMGLIQRHRQLQHTETLLHKTAAELRWYHARQEHLSATEKLVETATPSASLTRSFLMSAIQFIRSCSCGRGVLAWPLTSPTEDHGCLRLAFTLSYEFYVDPRLPVVRHGEVGRAGCAVGAQMRHPVPGDGLVSPHTAPSAGSSSSPSRLSTAEMKEAISYILGSMRRFGWVLVWQEDHHRWPTAVPPPHMHPAINTLPSYFPLRRSGCTRLHEHIAVSLEQWRQKQHRLNGKRYNADMFMVESKAFSSHQAVESSSAAALDVVESSPYTSLDLWQAALIGEEAGIYLWEGQKVFLDDGHPGVIVEFRPPPAELFMPAEQHTTGTMRAYWRVQQRLHAEFIRFYRWRRFCCAAAHPRHIAAAFTGLPSYVREREMSYFPVVELLHASPAGRRQRVQVLPRLTVQHRIAYPCVCVVSVAEQKRWHEAHGRVVLDSDDLRDEVWQLPKTGADGRSTSHVTLLRLPLSPVRVEEAASLFVSHVMTFSRSSADYHDQCDLWQMGSTSMECELLERLKKEWTSVHQNASARDRWTPQRRRAVQRLETTHWKSFAAKPFSMASLLY